MVQRMAAIGLVCLIALSGCAPAAGPGGISPPAPPEAGGRPPQTLSVVLVGEPRALTMWKETTTGDVVHIHEVISNALVGQDANSEPIPRLSLSVPSVEKGTWKVHPDGTMETTFQLQPNARWHDGTPFTAKDVAFSARAQVDPRVETFVRTLQTGGVDRIDTPDDKTVVMRWSKTHGFADNLSFWHFTPLPAHVLEAVYQRDPNDFNQHSYWTDHEVFVGTGPYKLVRWEKGAQMEFQAFDQYYLGRPKIGRIIVHIVGDPTTATARVLAGEMDIGWGGKWDKPNMDLVRERGIGDFVLSRENYRHLVFQFKDMAESIEVARDGRLRRALAHALDREALNQVGTDGLGMPSDSWVPPDDPRLKAAEPFIQKYPYDPRRAEQLFAQAGWARGSDGILRSAAGRTLSCAVRATAGNPVAAVVADNWRSVGVDAAIDERSAALMRDLEYRATYKCVEESARTLGRTAVEHLHRSNAAFPENRYGGSNRGSYVSAELDRSIDAFFAAVRYEDRLQAEREALRIITTDLPLMATYIDVGKHFQRKGVTGNVPKTGLDIMNSRTWNVHQWEKS